MNVVQLVQSQPETKKSNFDNFWAIYPNHLARFPAFKAWSKLSESDQMLALSAVYAHVRYWTAKGTELEYIPRGATWINQRRFEDELEIKKPAAITPKCAKCSSVLVAGWTNAREGKLCNTCWQNR